MSHRHQNHSLLCFGPLVCQKWIEFSNGVVILDISLSRYLSAGSVLSCECSSAAQNRQADVVGVGCNDRIFVARHGLQGSTCKLLAEVHLTTDQWYYRYCQAVDDLTKRWLSLMAEPASFFVGTCSDERLP
jgi:hypothetical protein